MVIEQLSKEKFDYLVKSEPDANLYQTSLFNAYLNREMIYLGVKKDDFYCAFASILINKTSWFKKEAVCEFGYLANFYDFEEIEEINSIILKYLKSLKVSSFIISPNIKFITSYGNNELLVKRIKSLGYEKIDDVFIYSTNLDNKRRIKTNKSIIVKECFDDDLVKNGFNLEVKKLRSNFGDNLHVFLSCFDFDNSTMDNQELQQINCVLKDNNYLRCTVVVDYANNLYLLKDITRSDLIDSRKSLLKFMSRFYNDKKSHSLICIDSYNLLEKTELIGKYKISI